jgi:molybdopterin synthase catalytic subunit
MVETTMRPIDPSEIYTRLNVGEAGSVAMHFAVVKREAEGKRSLGVLFQAQGDLEGELKSIEEKLRNQRPLKDVLLIRRIGKLDIGDIISAAAVAADGRDAAFSACREAVESFKKMKTLSKKELQASE